MSSILTLLHLFTSGLVLVSLKVVPQLLLFFVSSSRLLLLLHPCLYKVVRQHSIDFPHFYVYCQSSSFFLTHEERQCKREVHEIEAHQAQNCRRGPVQGLGRHHGKSCGRQTTKKKRTCITGTSTSPASMTFATLERPRGSAASRIQRKTRSRAPLPRSSSHFPQRIFHPDRTRSILS